MNLGNMMQMLSAFSKFKSNHPKFVSFAEHFIKTGVPADSVIEVTVTRPGEEPVTSNMKVLESDLELIRALGEMRQ